MEDRVTANELLLWLFNRVSRIRNRVPNNMFEYTIVHLTFSAPQTVVRLRMYAKVYLAVHLLQRQKYFRVEGKLKVYSTRHQPRI